MKTALKTWQYSRFKIGHCSIAPKSQTQKSRFTRLIVMRQTAHWPQRPGNWRIRYDKWSRIFNNSRPSLCPRCLYAILANVESDGIWNHTELLSQIAHRLAVFNALYCLGNLRLCKFTRY